jgi:hypothetical protein
MDLLVVPDGPASGKGELPGWWRSTYELSPIVNELAFVGKNPTLYSKDQMAALLVIASEVIQYAQQAHPQSRWCQRCHQLNGSSIGEDF